MQSFSFHKKHISGLFRFSGGSRPGVWGGQSNRGAPITFRRPIKWLFLLVVLMRSFRESVQFQSALYQ